MRLKQLELSGFKSFAKKTIFIFDAPVTAVVGPNGSGKSNCAEAFRWVLGERSMKALRGAKGEDLIWNGTPQLAKANRAAVTLTFDNHDRKFNVDFDEVMVTREVYRDGTNAYLINGSPVRHRDIIELLASVSLGSSDHYIVHQGDADRILSANLVDRRAMIEDALGLRLYQWKIEESEKKLKTTEENLDQVGSLRREIAPHLRFLKKQVEKLEQADKLRAELKTRYLAYLKQEEKYLMAERTRLSDEKTGPGAELAKVEARLAAQATVATSSSERTITERLKQLETERRQILIRKDEATRALGRLEGRLEIKENEQAERQTATRRDFSFAQVAGFAESLEHELGLAERLSDIFSLKGALQKLRQLIKNFLTAETDHQAHPDDHQKIVAEIRAEKEKVSASLAHLEAEEQTLLAEQQNLNLKLQAESTALREAEKETYELRATRTELLGRLQTLAAREDKLRLEEENFKREIEEGVILVDHEIRRYRELGPLVEGGTPAERDEARRQLERLKIKLEDMGAENGDVLKEYQETTERDAHLAKEIADLEASAGSLRQIIKNLEEEIVREFKRGLDQINERFQEFFALMFGGGTAELKLVQEERAKPLAESEDDEEARLLTLASANEATKEGIEIRVNLPRKKIKGLQMLSGGERALTSIALLFAMSQVNPPPFLILDETDAALDEANARKYGEMVASLAHHSQLILITHNRETMSRAAIIYGVTMGSDGVSRLLSIKFDEATSYAK